MKVVFYGSLIYHLTDTLRAKLCTPWTEITQNLDRLTRGEPLRYQLK